MNINDVGYNVTIGEPVVDAKGVADSGLSFPCKAIPDGDYLVTLEVNGTVIAGRDKATFASGSATVGDYTLSYSSYAVSVATLTDDDVVVLRIEPLDVKVSDAFRAVVGKAAPAGGGGSGGGGDVVVSHITADVSSDELVYSCDMTESEIEEALDAGKTVLAVFANAVSIWTMLSSPVADFITIFTRGNALLLYNSFVFSDGSLQRVSNSYTLTPAS